MSGKRDPHRSKIDVLRRQGTLNPSARKVRDPLFQENEFFDPHDIMQVKYEMLRRSKKDGDSITEAAGKFGFSRLSFYRVRAVFEKLGLAGFVPQKRGPKQAHKLTTEVMAFVDEQIRANPAGGSAEFVKMIEQRFGLTVHPRSIERAFLRRKKKRTQ